MANNRKRVIARMLKHEITKDTLAMLYWESIPDFTDTDCSGYCARQIRHHETKLIKSLGILWKCRIAPKQLHLSSRVRAILMITYDDWGEYFTGIPSDETEATTPWYNQLNTI
ncbi:hypothetical protein [Lacticaseibacillus sp. GG6-2]